MIKVLLIESDSETRDIIQVGLDNFQAFEVDHATDSWGVELFRENQYELVIVNVELANGVDGMEVVRQIRECKLGVAGHPREHVVEIVRNAACKVGHALQKLGTLAQRIRTPHLPMGIEDDRWIDRGHRQQR